MTALQTLIEEYEKKRKELSDSCLDLLKLEFNKFFEENPEVVNFNWTQYTQGFNDGEPCEFYVYDIWFTTTSEALKAEEEGNRLAGEDYAVDHSDLTPNMLQMEALIQSVPLPIMKDVFGDGVQVIVNKEAVSIDWYDHD